MLDRMLEIFMKFRFSIWWYVLISVFIFIFYKVIAQAGQKSKVKYDRIQRIVLFSFGIPLLLCSFLILVWFLVCGFFKDWLNNYMGILFIIGPVIIGGLIIFALKNEKKGQ